MGIARLAPVPLLLAVLAGCAATPKPKGPPPVGPPIPTVGISGLDRVMGKDARALTILFGPPDLDTREPNARKLQYASSICVLDAYLYAPAPGREPVVRHIDARFPNGDDFDRATCIAALSRRKEAR